MNTTDWLNPLLEPFAYVFMQQAFCIVLLVAVPTAVLSCFLVLKGWSLMGDAISHSVLPGPESPPSVRTPGSQVG